MTQTSLNNVSIRLKSGGHSFSGTALDAALHSASQSVEVVVLTPKTTLVPTEFFDVEHAADYLIELGLAPTISECVVHSVDKEGIIAVMAMSHKCYDELKELIPSGVIFTSPLLEGDVPVEGSIIHLEDGVLYVRIYRGVLRFAEAFECKTDADVLYYLATLNSVYNIYNMYACARGDVKRLQKLLKRLFKNFVCE